MQRLIKYTYLLDNNRLAAEIEKWWRLYQRLIADKSCSWAQANEARAILYFLGYIFPEIVVCGSLARRVPLLRPKISLDDFLSAVDSREQKILRLYEHNQKFKQLERFYLLVKALKNRVAADGSYLAEETFNKFYARRKPKNYF